MSTKLDLLLIKQSYPCMPAHMYTHIQFSVKIQFYLIMYAQAQEQVSY